MLLRLLTWHVDSRSFHTNCELVGVVEPVSFIVEVAYAHPMIIYRVSHNLSHTLRSPFNTVSRPLHRASRGLLLRRAYAWPPEGSSISFSASCTSIDLTCTWLTWHCRGLDWQWRRSSKNIRWCRKVSRWYAGRRPRPRTSTCTCRTARTRVAACGKVPSRWRTPQLLQLEERKETFEQDFNTGYNNIGSSSKNQVPPACPCVLLICSVSVSQSKVAKVSPTRSDVLCLCLLTSRLPEYAVNAYMCSVSQSQGWTSKLCMLISALSLSPKVKVEQVSPACSHVLCFSRICILGSCRKVVSCQVSVCVCVKSFGLFEPIST